jgi:glycosyltransferase involved in cell wall biosynthesis
MNSSGSRARRATILFLDHTAVLGGGEIALFNLITHLDQTRFRPIVVLFTHGELETQLREAGIETHVLPLSPSVVETRKDDLNRSILARGRDIARVVHFTLRLARFIRRKKPDIVHTNSLKADIIGGIAARLAGVLLLWHVRDRIADDYLPHKVVAVFRWASRVLPHVIIANSRATFETLQLPPRPNNPSRPVHDGLIVGDEPDVHPMQTGAPRIGIIGRITWWKGQHIFLDAAKIIAAEFPDARFPIIGGALFGETKYEKLITSKIEESKLHHNIEWLGFRDDVPQLIEDLDILVHASVVGEPFGQVVIEGMVAGKPVVATRGGGVPEIIEDGKNGVLVPMGDASALADAVLELLRDPVRAQKIGAAGYERVRDYFSIERVARDVETVYDAMLESKKLNRLENAPNNFIILP